MARPLRFLPDGSGLVEITVRCIQGRFLLTPSLRMNEIFIGCLARAQRLHHVRLHAFCCLANHFHLLLSGVSSKQISDFMRHLNTNLSKEVGRLHDWRGALFERRHQRIPVSDEPVAQINRLRYILSQGAKEGLVARPSDWPGVHCVEALLHGERLEGTWFDRTRAYVVSQRKTNVDADQFKTRCTVALEPIPCWQGLSKEAIQQQIQNLIVQIEQDAAADRRSSGRRPLGIQNILKQDPHSRPKRLRRSPAPRFHAASKRVFRRLFEAFNAFVEAFRKGAALQRARPATEGFPEGCFPPAPPFVFSKGIAA